MGIFSSTEVPSSIGFTSKYSFPTSNVQTPTTNNSTGGFFSSGAGQNTIGQSINSFLGLGTSLVATNQQKQLLKQQAQIEADKAKNQLAIAQLQLEASRGQSQNIGATSSGKTMLYVGLGVGAVVILGVIIFAVTRKKAE